MTNQHPLTDEICDKIQDSVHPCDPANMRTAADWQLERCTEELDWLLYVFAISGAIDEAGREAVLGLFKEAMRPQENG